MMHIFMFDFKGSKNVVYKWWL